MQIKLKTMAPRRGFLPTCQWLGTVIAGQQRGALMTLEGRYFLVTARGDTVPLDPLEVAQAMAAALEARPGRPLRHAERMVRYDVTLPPALADLARRLGEGNLSLGIRRALINMEPTDGTN